MTPLRQKMIDAMILRGFAARTQETYLYAVTHLAKHFHQSPDTISDADIQAFFLYLSKERQLSSASCRLHLNALRFFYREVLGRADFGAEIKTPKKPQRIPELLTRQEALAIVNALVNLKHRMLLMTCYGCGLRVSELVNLQVRHLDHDRQLIRIEQAKGAKDRLVLMPASLAENLVGYQRRIRPTSWLFSGPHSVQHLSISTVQRVFHKAKRDAGIRKDGGIHSLRHAYATHQLEAGMPVHQLQRLLGHSDVKTTMRYIHWIPRYADRVGVDLLATVEVSHG
jgi:site-specific recombinase XerD